MPDMPGQHVSHDGRSRLLLFANLETRRVVHLGAAIADQRGVLVWHEFECDADADDAAAEALADRLTRAGQQASRRCRSRDRAGARLARETPPEFWKSSAPEASVSPSLVPAFLAEQQRGC